MPPEPDEQEHLLGELGRLTSELAKQQRLSAMVAHDLATPAQVIIGLTEVLLEHPGLDPFVIASLDQLYRSAMTMSSLVAELGDQLGAEHHPSFAVERVDLADLVSSVVSRSRILSSSKDIAISLHVAQPVRGYWVDGDPPKLERALSNLVGNAVKFSPADSTVEVRLARADGQAAIQVADQGPGITPEGQQRIFEVFHREEGTAHLPGMGLGLYITRQIVDGHGGRVELRPETDEGATFELRLPFSTNVTLSGTG